MKYISMCFRCTINSILFSIALFIFPILLTSNVLAYDTDNEFIPCSFPGAFPGENRLRTFEIPLSPDNLLIVVPNTASNDIPGFRKSLTEKCGINIPFVTADDVNASDLTGKNLVIVGNIMNNRWALDLYKRRYAFADDFFPGDGGVIIHPVSSIWSDGRFALVIGVSTDDDIAPGFGAFLDLLDQGAKSFGPLHYLKTSHKIPTPPQSVESIFDSVRDDIETTRVNYSLMPNWGLYYYLTGDRKWAEHFRDGMYFLYERAEKTGKWIPEPWTNVYFILWKTVMVWDLLDNDPVFTPEDHRIIDEVLWGYFNFCRGEPIPLLDMHLCPPGEIRQNHQTFMALSLFQAHRYFTGKYGACGLDDAADKFRRCFDGQALSFRPNDDAGGYLNYSVTHLLNYMMAMGDDAYLESGKLHDAAGLMVATIDNRGDPVSLGDVGGYPHRKKGSRRSYEDKFLSMAAWYHNDEALQWLSNWRTKDSVFNLETLYSGDYVADIPEKYPEKYIGIHPVYLDDATIRWGSARTSLSSHLPRSGERYIDKMALRSGFDPDDEYLLMDGISFLAHGHLDGNTVTRLTWKDRLWLVDADYIKLTPQYHNGIVIAKDGVQEEPPPFTVLDYASETDHYGFTRTVSRDFNDADWSRNIIWKKGGYFLFLDEITANSDGDYRLESRWRTLGEVELAGNSLTARQDGASFHITSADSAPKRIVHQKEVSVCLARKRLNMKSGTTWTFANLMTVDDKHATPSSLTVSPDDIYCITHENAVEAVGLNADALNRFGLSADASLFLMDTGTLRLVNARTLRFGDSYIDSDSSINLTIDYIHSSGKIIVPDGGGATINVKGISIDGTLFQGKEAVEIAAGAHSLKFKGSLFTSVEPLKQILSTAREMHPETQKEFMSFGLDSNEQYASDDIITSSAKIGDSVLTGTEKGVVSLINTNGINEIFGLENGRGVRIMRAADITGDGALEILVGDNAEGLFCYSATGTLLWKHKMKRYFGTNANANDICIADTGSGVRTVFVTTNGWKLYAFRPDGSVLWESFIYYHALTKAKYLSDGGDSYLAVGTSYSTPLNVVDPATGDVRWFTWEQVGDEYLSTTNYCGIHLTDMIFADTDLDGDKEIVFGTKYNRIYSLDTKSGATKWSANVGDEVTVIKEIATGINGGITILAATDAGDLVVLDRSGEIVNRLSLDSSISDILPLKTHSGERQDFAVCTVDGRIIICDDSLRVRASYAGDGLPFNALVLAENGGNSQNFYGITDTGVIQFSYHSKTGVESRFH